MENNKILNTISYVIYIHHEFAEIEINFLYISYKNWIEIIKLIEINGIYITSKIP